jgi:hypothetical protein
MRTVGFPFTIVFGGGSGMSACGSVTMSPMHAAGFPPIPANQCYALAVPATGQRNPRTMRRAVAGWRGALGIGQVC